MALPFRKKAAWVKGSTNGEDGASKNNIDEDKPKVLRPNRSAAAATPPAGLQTSVIFCEKEKRRE
jgi:hypothetical protein